MVDHPYTSERVKAAETAAEKRVAEGKQAIADANLLAVMETRAGRGFLARLRSELRSRTSDGCVALDARAHYERALMEFDRWLTRELLRISPVLVGQMQEEQQ